jgi:hypothetical protein
MAGRQLPAPTPCVTGTSLVFILLRDDSSID